MIVSKCVYRYDIGKRNNTSNSCTDDALFLLRQFVKQTKQHYPIMVGALKAADNRFEENIYRAKLIDISPTGIASPNSVSTYRLMDGNPICGDFSIHHDRVSLTDFFNIEEINEEKYVILYEDYCKALFNGELDSLLHSTFGYRLGNGFAQCGAYLDSTLAVNQELTGRTPLAIVMPSGTEISDAWRHFVNVENVKKGSMLYQDLLVGVKLTSSNHAFIMDGSVYITIRLRRPVHHYVKDHEEVEHAD